MSGRVSGTHAFERSTSLSGWLRWVAKCGYLTTRNSEELVRAANRIDDLEAEVARLKASNESMDKTLKLAAEALDRANGGGL